MAAEYRNDGGIQNINSTVSGAQAVGTGAVASVGAASPSQNALAEAVALLTRQLPSLDLDPAAAEDAEAHLEDLGAEAAAGHGLAVWRELTDTAWDHGILPDDALTPRKAAARIVRLGELDPATAESVHRVAGAVEQVLFAPRPQPVPGLPDDVRRLRAALRARVGRLTRIRAIVAPRSAVRALGDLADRWTAFKAGTAERWTALVRRPSGRPGEQSG